MTSDTMLADSDFHHLLITGGSMTSSLWADEYETAFASLNPAQVAFAVIFLEFRTKRTSGRCGCRTVMSSMIAPFLIRRAIVNDKNFERGISL